MLTFVVTSDYVNYVFIWHIHLFDSSDQTYNTDILLYLLSDDIT